MSNKLKVEVHVGLVDRLTGPFKALHANLLRTSARLSMMGQGAAQAGRTISMPLINAVSAAGKLSSTLTEVGIVADASAARMAAIRPEIRALARESNQFSTDLADALGILTGKGIGLDDALAGLRDLARATTAAKANMTDMSETQGALLINAKISADQMGRAFEMLIKSDVEGAFKLRNMAKELPALTAAAAGVKLTGLEQVSTLGATLQIAMRGAGSESEAANNVLNLLQKLTSKETVANAKTAWGVDLPAAFARWQTEGLNPVLEMLQLIQKKTGGDAFKISKVFGDMQVMAALRPLLGDMQGLLDLKAKLEGSTGLVDQMFSRRMGEDPMERYKALTIRVQDLSDRLGVALLPVLERISSALGPILESIGKWTEANPTLAANLAIFVGAAAALLVVLGPLAMGIGGLMGGLGMLTAGLGLIASPVGLVVAGLAGLAYAIAHLNMVSAMADLWKPIGEFEAKVNAFFGGWEINMGRWGADAISGLVSGLKTKWHELIDWLRSWDLLPDWVKRMFGIGAPPAAVGATARDYTADYRRRTNMGMVIVPPRRSAGTALPEGSEPGGGGGGLWQWIGDLWTRVKGIVAAPLAAIRRIAGPMALAGAMGATPSAAALAGHRGPAAGVSMPITITVQAPPGADPQRIADLVRREVQNATGVAGRRIAALYDGTDWM